MVTAWMIHKSRELQAKVDIRTADVLSTEATDIKTRSVFEIGCTIVLGSA